MKTRIISETKCNKTIYKVQHKFLFWWITDRYTFYDDLGTTSYEESFNTIEDAENYICQKYSKPIFKII
jgi:hypothetical protein